MDAACLRVRFIPLLQNICKDQSKCCLEIVPEIVCLKNLDKLQWSQGDHSIEYKIPITYKVTLQRTDIKKNTDKDCDENDLKKIYHSCVDLLIPSSSLNMNLASGDVTRIISDTIMLNTRFTSVKNVNCLYGTASYCVNPTRNVSKAQITNTQMEDAMGTIHLTTSDCISSTRNVPEKHITQSHIEYLVGAMEMETTNSQETDTNPDPQEEIDSNVQILQVINKNTGDGQLYLNEKATNAIPEYYTQSTSTAVRGHKYADYSIERKRKLSVTPIYSIDTCDCGLVEDKIVISDEISFCVQEPKTNLVYIEKKYNNTVIANITKTNDDYRNSIDTAIPPHTPKTKGRILPELRVANFVQKMEQEIFPLKIMLNEMIGKCASLGFVELEQQKSNSTIHKSVLNMENETKNQWCKKKCNRVVYSIVFDD